jgi:uroporphyrinogen-III synthase
MSPQAWTVHTGTRAAPVLELLRDLGRRPRHLPLLHTVPVDGPRPDPPRGATVLVTSRATAQHGAASLLALCPGRRVLAVGPGTARALAELGVAVDGVAEGSGAALLTALGADPAVFVGALRPASTLRAALRQRGKLVHWPVYDRVAVPQSLEWLGSSPAVAAALFTSPAGVEEWARASRDRPLAAAIGPTTAAALRAAGFSEVALAETPTPGALVAALSAATCG